MSVGEELLKPTIDLRELPPGRQLDVVLGEGDDCQDQARMVLELIEVPNGGFPAKFRVVSADLDPRVIEKNREAGMREPEQMGGEIWVMLSCTYRRDYMPPITLAQEHAIAEGRHAFMWIPNPSEQEPGQGLKYHAEVLRLGSTDGSALPPRFIPLPK